MLLQKEIIELYVSIPTDQHFENPSDFRTETYHLTYIEFAKSISPIVPVARVKNYT